jgi:hypothetical protein
MTTTNDSRTVAALEAVGIWHQHSAVLKAPSAIHGCQIGINSSLLPSSGSSCPKDPGPAQPAPTPAGAEGNTVEGMAGPWATE